MLKSTVSIVLLIWFALGVLNVLGVNIAPFIASAGVVGLAIGFGAQNLVRDFVTGVFMLLEDQYGVGDVVDLGEAIGEVESVGLRVTTVRDIDGTLWYVRNGEIARATIAEWAYDLRSRLQGQMRHLFLGEPPPSAPPVAATPADPSARPVDWGALRAEAMALEQRHMATNPYGVRQDYLDTYLTDLTPERLDAYPDRFDSSTELNNLERLMRLLSAHGVRALFVLQPYNPLVFRDLNRFEPEQRRIADLCKTYAMHCLDMYNAQPYQVGTLRDSQHLGELGWLDVSHKAMEVFAP